VLPSGKRRADGLAKFGDADHDRRIDLNGGVEDGIGALDAEGQYRELLGILDSLLLQQGDRSTKLSIGNMTVELSMGNLSTKVALGQISEDAMQSITMTVGENRITTARRE
jgi:hypothetical protein